MRKTGSNIPAGGWEKLWTIAGRRAVCLMKKRWPGHGSPMRYFLGTHFIMNKQVVRRDETVKIYYGVSDTVECMATAKLEDLIGLCK